MLTLGKAYLTRLFSEVVLIGTVVIVVLKEWLKNNLEKSLWICLGAFSFVLAFQFKVLRDFAIAFECFA